MNRWFKNVFLLGNLNLAEIEHETLKEVTMGQNKSFHFHHW